MIYLRLISIFVLLLTLSSSSCNNFERETQVIKLLKDKENIDVEREKSLQVIVLQDNVCGACSESVLDFVFDLDLQNSLIVLSDENEKLLYKFRNEIGEQNMLIDSTYLIEKYGLRYARSLIVSFEKGKLDFWSFIEEKEFEKIRRKMKRL